ncbi:MAG: hypothetical protein MJ091_05660 [Clostridia bacterium]|nr:hypothetical protein [Clostridia bacterium]
MAETKFLTYKDKPLVRKDNVIYYGDMSEKYVIKFEILSENNEIADKVSINLIKNEGESPDKAKPEKTSVKETLFDALDLGFTWLERALKN